MPSKKVLEEKKQVVAELTDLIGKASSGILVDYRGVSVEQDTVLRRKFREAGVDYRVVKNTLTRFACKETGYEELDPFLNGPTSLALTFGEPVAAAKVLSEFAKTNDKIKIKAGFVENKVIDAKGVEALASLPPKEELIAKMLGSMMSPISGFANVLNANLRGLVVALNAIAEKQA